jgi:hypothetical protein
MKNNKVFKVIPDGVGLRNFAYTDFSNLDFVNKKQVQHIWQDYKNENQDNNSISGGGLLQWT